VKSIEVRMILTPKEFELIRICVKEICALLHCEPEARPVILNYFLEGLRVTDIEQLYHCFVMEE